MLQLKITKPFILLVILVSLHLIALANQPSQIKITKDVKDKLFLKVIHQRNRNYDSVSSNSFILRASYQSIKEEIEKQPLNGEVIITKTTKTVFKNIHNNLDFKYKLVGYDSIWKSTKDTIVTYENLPIGHYKFVAVLTIDEKEKYTSKFITIAPDRSDWYNDEIVEFPNIVEVLLITNEHLLNVHTLDDDYKSFKWDPFVDSIDAVTNLPINLILPYDQNNLRFIFNPYFDGNVKYILEGLDTAWQKISIFDLSARNYLNLPSGKYTLKLCSEELGCAESTSEFSFEISPPFYKTKKFVLFIISIIILIIISIFGLIYYSTFTKKKNVEFNKRKLAEIELKALRAQMNPHFIFNSLSSIQSLMNQGDVSKANIFISKYAELTRFILDHSDKQLVYLSEELHALELYIQLELLRFEFNYTLNVSSDIDLDNIQVPPMLIQPFVENAINHGLADKKKEGIVNIDIRERDHLLICTVADNGIGRKEAELRKSKNSLNYKSKGIAITKERLALLNISSSFVSELVIKDILNENNNVSGTKVILTFPLEY